MNIIRKVIPTSNYQVGRTKPITKIVMHWMAGNLAGAQSRFSNPTSGVSAHYGIENNTIYQWVEDKDTGYHAGNLSVNQESIGIEHSANIDRPASEDTYKTSGELVRDLCKRYNIPLDRIHIIKHSEVPRATQCPGTLDIDKIIAIAKNSIIPPITEPLPMNDQTLIPINATSVLEAYTQVELGTLRSKLLDKDAEIKRLREQLANVPTPTPVSSVTKKDIVDLLRRLTQLAEL